LCSHNPYDLCVLLPLDYLNGRAFQSKHRYQQEEKCPGNYDSAAFAIVSLCEIAQREIPFG
jgi:hypothetical protein